MPGIHVRKASWINWNQQRETPILTVPSSYWLCHKNNIYKFIFRYHRTIKNTQQFYFGKELMNVIRRILKDPPRQGQQFCTSHLLITYSNTSWTRQDKIFALMKFKERSVIAFSYAFILTIKITLPSESTELNTRYAIKSSPDRSLIQNNKNTTHSSKNDFPKQTNQCNNVQEEVLEAESKSIQLNNSLEVDDLTNTCTDKKSTRQIINCKNTNKFTNCTKVSFEPPIPLDTPSENDTKSTNKAQASRSLRHSTVKSKSKNKNTGTNNKYSTLQHSIVNKIEENKVVTNESKDTNHLEKENIKDKNGQDEHVGKNGFAKDNNNSTSNINIVSEDSNTDAVNVDSINLPYQYLIEREIEDAKRKMLNDNVSVNETKKRKLDETNEKHSTNSVEQFADVTKTEGTSCLQKRKHLSDNAPSRSSDITDLVMEGLMFTIRQGQDTVAVIEQKTKLEVDEVLENSEKIETKKGEKCLRNSSLLGLENLITMIELPKQTENESKCQNTISPELKHAQQQFPQSLTSTSISNDDEKHDVANKGRYSELYNYEYNKNMKLTEDGNLEYEEEEEEEEEEDIIPEALQAEIFQSSVLDFQKIDKPENKLEIMMSKDLLMDDTDTEKSNKHETTELKPFSKKLCLKTDYPNNESLMKSTELPIIANGTHKVQHYINTKNKPTFNNMEKCKSNGPIVISNEIITADQIPIPLQKIFEEQSPKKSDFSLKKKNETDGSCSEVHRAQSCQKTDIVSNVQLKGQSLDCDILKSTQYPQNSQIPVCHDDKNRCESPLPVTSKTKLEDATVSKNNFKLNEQSHKQIANTDKVEQLSSNEIQDITHEFYKDLSFVQKKRNLPSRYLRPRRKSINMLTDENLGDTHIEIMKFFHDITRGAKVVVKRMSTKSIHSIIGKSSSLTTCMQ
ncbi:uncharacterized protein LOC122399022 [Colletes gigas]|uniref:uncharacterized protein LOC122399022 n=1 Tax=Colletes gigas TaxID=935657 RepID=UPI001C9A8112|nr:uncharacterized protein LOC122399022 [Colletes gigas]XP_043255265.1 uncharacterized protein LOC122399022 [Colletes gigas]XP_043255266.1 uncharacterized protein LOC122399022 [Colletes gigas]XP_043255267.1 uncharacterized protein LOC122399022 [Colletes gigas]XP_043255268.1 uncharacterized protein LOC122399022 [Colletes gigas]